MNMKKLIAVAAIIAICAARGAVAGTPFDLQSEIDAAAERGGGVVRIAPGDHETKPFVLKSNITLEFAEGARILASTNLADYVETPAKQCFFIYAENATNISIVGKGGGEGLTPLVE